MGNDGNEVREFNDDIKKIGDNTKETVDRIGSYKYAAQYAKGKDGDYLENYYKGMKEYDKRCEERDKKLGI